MLPPVSTNNSENTKILIVDDETETGQFIVRLLQRQNYQMSTVLSGEEALVFVETHPDTEIMLLDLMMPGLDGFDVLEQLKSNPKTAQIKVIVVTATNRVQDKIKAFSMGAADFLVKPFNKGELIARIETQANLKRAEEKINALARFPTEAPHPILRISATGDLLYSNIAGVELLQNEQDQVNTTIPAGWRDTVQHVLQSQKRIEVEFQNGDKIYTCMFVPLVSLGYVNVYGTDITDRIQVEKALRKSEERHRTLAENARDLIAKLTSDGTFTYVSAASSAILGYPPQALLGRSLYDLIHPDDRAEIEQMSPPLLDPASEAIFTVRFEHSHHAYVWLESSVRGVRTTDTDEVELVVVARDVTERKRYEAALQQAYDKLEQNVAERTAALSHSNHLLKQVIEERKQAESLILQFNQELLALQYAGTAIASSLDLQYVLHTVTSEMVEMLQVEGCALSEWNHQTEKISVSAKFGPDTWWTNGSLAGDALAAEVLRHREYKQIVAGSSTPLNENVKTLLVLPLVIQDRAIGYVEIADSRTARTFTNQEISLAQLLASQAASAIQNARLYQQAQQELAERKRMEETLEKERATLARRVEERTAELSAANAKLSRTARLKDEFLASMSHELRTPLNAVLSMSEALQEEVYGNLNPKQMQSLKNIEESGRHLLALINDILDLSKIEAGKLELRADTVSVQQVCRASLLFIKQTAHKKRIKVLSRFDRQSSTLQADERRLKQMLVNLLSNAVKFTPEGGTVGLEVITDAERQAINFTVWDTGIGIPKDRMDRLFQPFIQLDSKLSRRYAGTGLGLALVRRMAEMHGGSVTLASKVKHGSRFTISLPWQAETQAKPLANRRPTTAATISIGRALIVEDSPVVADQYERYFAEFGVETHVCRRGKTAVATAQKFNPEVIILDIMLPDHPGWEILKALKQNKATQKIPVIVASVLDESELGSKLGAAEYLVKPVSRQRLQQALEQVCRVQLSPLAGVAANGRAATLSALNGHVAAADVDEKDKPLILLAEDHEVNLNTVSDYLLNIGYRVVAARNGVEAIDRAREETPNLILMDIQMPEMDGFEAMQRLRADARFAQTPIIALTALAMPGDREQCLAAGANEYMSKPISLKGLTQMIQTQLNHHQPKKG